VSLRASVLFGGLLGLLLFAAESALVLQPLPAQFDEAVLPFMQAARPLLPGLLLRIAAAYVLGGALLGLAAGWLARNKLQWSMTWLLLFALFAWHAAAERPALIDDLPRAGMLLAVVTHCAPWLPLLLLGLFLALHGRRALPVALGALATLMPLRETKGEGGPLVLLFGIDAFRPDHLHAAPNLRRLLADGSLFTRAYTPLAQTEPAWSALLTASWPNHTGVRYPLTADGRKARLPTLASAFADAGYPTTFVTDCSRFNWQGEASGFQTRIEPPRGALNFLLEKLRYRSLAVFSAPWLVPEMLDNRALAGLYDPLAYARRLAGRIDHGLFAFHDTAAHYPGDPVYPFYKQNPEAAGRLRMTFAPPGAAQPGSRAADEALYDELLAQADAQLGVVLDDLRARHLYDEAWIAVFSDHGEDFYADHPELEGTTPVHGARLGDDENRIVLTLKPPRSFGAVPRQIDQLVRLIDLGPTLLEALHLPPLPGADGESLLPLLRGEEMRRLRLYAETGYTHAPPDVFDKSHFSGGPRGLESYRVRPDGAVEMTEAAHQTALREKDVGAFDGDGWLLRSPGADGSRRERCAGTCAPSLYTFLDSME